MEEKDRMASGEEGKGRDGGGGGEEMEEVEEDEEEPRAESDHLFRNQVGSQRWLSFGLTLPCSKRAPLIAFPRLSEGTRCWMAWRRDCMRGG